MATTFMHPYLGNSRLTIAIEHEEGNPVAKAAVAFCSPKDQFARRKGRKIALDRLRHGGTKYNFSVPFKEDSFGDAVFRELIFYAKNYTFVPSWAHRAAKRLG